ncbi:MAG: hypothetical protein HY820_19710 [Acidobacteria bacterium]|nr:hypothetical protein [Acidobacteriota bacterium]
MRKPTWILLVLTAIVASIAGLRAYQSQSNAALAANVNTTVLVWMGVNATAPTKWDGSAAVTVGKLVSVTGRHFSEEDSVTGTTWKAQTRRDAVAPFADVNYTEMRPGSQPEVRHQPIGVQLEVEGPATARVNITTDQGPFDFSLAGLGLEPLAVLQGKALVSRIPTAEKLSSGEYEDDEPSIASVPGGVAVAWVAYKGQAERVFLRSRSANGWTAAEEVTTKPGDIFRTSLAALADGTLWVFWSERDGERWSIWGRRKAKDGAWSAPERISGEGSATFHRAAAADGTVHITWQNLIKGQSDIYLRSWSNNAWQPEVRVSESSANDWEPAIAAGGGAAHIVWDSYDQGQYDIHYRSYRDGKPGPLTRVTEGPRFQAHAAIAVDSQGRPWLAWNESGVNWGKDQGFLVPTPLATPLHQERWLQMVYLEGGAFQEPWPAIATVLPTNMRRNAEHPQLIFNREGVLTLLYRHWTRRLSRSIGSAIVWDNYATTYDGQRWTTPKPIPQSGSWIEKHPGLAVDPNGEIWAAWMTDNRPFATMIPGNSDVLAARLANPGPNAGSISKRPYVEPMEEAIPIHTNDAEDVKTIRGYTFQNGGKTYRIIRGDMHRHTDLSQDFKYDGSLFEVYRYALDAAGFDYIAPTDHQAGYDQEFSWWQNQKYVDLFLMPGSFVPLFAYERSLRFPNGHRNIVWAKRGFRTMPIPAAEASGQEGAKKLFAHLKETGGISMPHSSATDQGTDWRDNDPQVEPLMEIYQGYRASYEYEGAPKAATTLNQHAQKSGWQPAGFYWNALAKGYKIGVQASSDHWSTHISYACLLVEGTSREHLLDAIRKRHAYAATDNIILDFRARAGGAEHIMGDAFEGAAPPVLSVTATGTNPIKQVDIIRDKQFLYTSRPQKKAVQFTFTDTSKAAGESWYYVRVLQEDGQIAWSSPIWIRK